VREATYRACCRLQGFWTARKAIENPRSARGEPDQGREGGREGERKGGGEKEDT